MNEGGPIVWEPDMSVGVDVLDDDHKILIECLNQFVAAADNDEGILSTDGVFSALIRYTDYHFRREEGIMRACGYPALEAHKALHAKLRQRVIDSRERYLRNRDGVIDDEVRNFLKSWLTDHILACDMDYKSAVAGREGEFAELLEP